MEELKVKEKISYFKKLFKRNKSAACILSAVLCCTLVVTGLLLFMPKGYATAFTYGDGSSIQNSKELVLAHSGNRWTAILSGDNNYYLLDGEGKNLNSGIDITIQGGTSGTDGYYDVYLTLKDVNINLSSDVSGITFKFADKDTTNEPVSGVNIFDETLLNRNKVRIHLYLMGDSSIRGVAGAQSPLIEAENYNFVTETYYPQGQGEGSLGKFIYYSQYMELLIESASGSEYRDSLTLTTGQGSYGAAIGGRGGNPIMKKLEEIGISEEAYKNIEANKKYEDKLHFYYYDKGTFLVDLSPYSVPSLEFGAARVNIKSGVVNIEGNGYGAGIGNGGCKSSETRLVTFPTLYDKTINASAQSNTSSVRIDDGTVSVIMTGNSKGSCFVNGAESENIAEDGLVTIMGGSVYLQRQNNTSPYSNAFNEYKDKLYAFAAHYNDDADTAKTGGEAILNRDFDLDNIWETENEEYKYVVTRFFENSQPKVENDFTGKGMYYLNTYVKMTSGYGSESKYKFTGFKHDSKYSDDTLYFYLPATRYNSYGLIIKDNVGTDGKFVPSYEFAVLNKEQIDAQGSYDTYTYVPYSNGAAIKQTKYVLVKLSGIPSYCTGITGTYTQNGVSSNFEKPIQRGDDWYLYTGEVKGDMVMDITYSIGNYKIVYNYGLLDIDNKDESNGSIVNKNSTSVECGTEYELLTNNGTDVNVSWSGRTFEGWYADPNLAVPVTSVVSDVVGDTKTVYAKWSCDVIYKIEGGIGKFNSTGKDEIRVKLPYGSKFDFMSDANLPDSERDIDMGESSDLFEFKGWEYNDIIYNKGDNRISEITVSKDTYIKAAFERSGFYVYITATYGDDTLTHRDIKAYLGENTDDTFRMDFSGGERRNLLSSSPNENGYYYSTTLLNSEYVTVTLVPKAGYRIAGKEVKDVNGNNINLIANDITSDDNKNQFSFSMAGRNKDIYIYIHFDVEQYDIAYYDNINGSLTQIDGMPNPDVYSIDSGDINFTRPVKTDRDRYWKFLGFKEFGKDELITSIPAGSRTGNLTLIAQWEEVKVYDINIDSGIGIIKAYVEGDEVTRAAEGETVTLTATVNPGIRLKGIEYKWKEESGLELSHNIPYDITNTTVSIEFIMPAAVTEVRGDFEAIEYVITYLNLNGARNDNPSIYTVFDTINLAPPVKEGRIFKGWRLIIPNDETTDDISDVKMVDIEKIENRFGNLMLYADWEEGDDISSVYRAYVDDGIVNGQVELTKTEAVKNEWVFVRVSENTGYKLSALVYTPELPDERLRVSPLERYSMRSVSVDISINKVADGLYYFVMPDSDVEITAVFKPVTYNISYIPNGGKHTNVDKYTIEDDIMLNDAAKTGYTFIGWYNERGEKVEKLHYATGNMVLSARWMTAINDNNTDNGNDNKDNDNNTDNDNTGGSPDDGGNKEKPDEPAADIKDKPNTYVTGNVQTGDGVDVTRLIIICVICGAILLLLIIPKRKKEDEDEKENEIDKEYKNNVDKFTE